MGIKWEKFPFKVEKQYRLQNWDYSDPGYYFVTICTKDRVDYFGEISDSKMTFSKIGMIANNLWQEIPKHFKNIKLDQFVVMPDHIHGILRIKDGYICRNMLWHVPTKTKDNNLITPWHVPTKINKFASPIAKSISVAINHFKGAVKRECNRNDIEFAWQTRFHDRIIRNKPEYWAMKTYVSDNPKNWDHDKDNCSMINL